MSGHQNGGLRQGCAADIVRIELSAGTPAAIDRCDAVGVERGSQ